MSAFFINSSEVLILSLLNNKHFHYNQQEMARCIGCAQPKISNVVSSLLEKGLVEDIKGFIAVNQYAIVESLVAYASAVYETEIYFTENILKIRNWTPETYAFFSSYFRIFNIEYVIAECKELQEICFVFKNDMIDISNIDT